MTEDQEHEMLEALNIALRGLLARIEKLEREVRDLKSRG